MTTRTAIRIALDSENGNLHRAATRLGVTDRALQMRRAADQSARKRRAGVGSYDTAVSVPPVVRHSGWRDGEGSNAEIANWFRLVLYGPSYPMHTIGGLHR